MRFWIKRFALIILVFCSIYMSAGCDVRENAELLTLPPEAPSCETSASPVQPTGASTVQPTPTPADTISESPLRTVSVPAATAPQDAITPEATEENKLLVSEYNDGIIRLGMPKADVTDALRQNGIEYTVVDASYPIISTHDSRIKGITLDKQGNVQLISSNSTTSAGLKIGDSVVDMVRIYGMKYIDMGAGLGLDSFLYDFGDYTLMVEFYDNDVYVVTGWTITSMGDYSWETFSCIIPPHDGAASKAAINDSDKAVKVGSAEFYLGMGKQEAIKEAEDNQKAYEFLVDGSMTTGGGLEIFFDENGNVNRMRLSGLNAAASRGMKAKGSIFDMIAFYGFNYEIIKEEGRYPNSTYRYGNGEISIDICFLDYNPYGAEVFDVYYSDLYPIYK